MKETTHWEQMGATSGLLATLMFVLSFIVFLVGADPTGDPSLPNVGDADFAPAYLAANLSAVRVAVLLSSLGLALFLWFLGSLWTTLRRAEGEPARGSTLVLVSGVAGTVLILVGLLQIATAGLTTSPAQADNVPTLYIQSSLMVAYGGAVLSLFFFGVARVVLRTPALGTWLGVLAIVAGLLAVCGFMTPFFEANVLNAATGALGKWAWATAFVVWLALASISMTLEQRRVVAGTERGIALAEAEGAR